MPAEFLYRESEWLIAIGFLLVLIVCGETGFRLARRHHAQSSDITRSQFSNVQNGILGLVALLLAFTFSMAVTRFGERKQLVVDEANSIGTTWLRADLLPAPQRTAVRDLLRRYVDARIAYSAAGIDAQKIAAATRDTNALQALLWAQAVELSHGSDRVYTESLFTSALNDTIDMSGKRLAAMNDHVPETVLWMLLLASGVSLLTVGYGFGLGAKRSAFSVAALALLIVLVVMLILDFDRPRRGFIQVSEGDFAALRATMNEAGK